MVVQHSAGGRGYMAMAIAKTVEESILYGTVQRRPVICAIHMLYSNPRKIEIHMVVRYTPSSRETTLIARLRQ
jgi:hypothetical protein